MRLIDADRLKINLYHNKKVVLNDDLVKCIDDTETAYDIEKVIKELEKESFTTTDTVCGGIFKAIRTISAIEIIKHGGVSDDVCEWNLDGVYIFSPHSKMFSCVIDDKHRYTYCPVCGKKIKVVKQMDEDELRYCHHDDTDEYNDCLDYMECEECPYYYSDLDQESD